MRQARAKDMSCPTVYAVSFYQFLGKVVRTKGLRYDQDILLACRLFSFVFSDFFLCL